MTDNQYRLLRSLCSLALVYGTRRQVGPLIRRGWVRADRLDGRHYVMVRVTSDGLRALADEIDRREEVAK